MDGLKAGHVRHTRPVWMNVKLKLAATRAFQLDRKFRTRDHDIWLRRLNKAKKDAKLNSHSLMTQNYENQKHSNAKLRIDDVLHCSIQNV